MTLTIAEVRLLASEAVASGARIRFRAADGSAVTVEPCTSERRAKTPAERMREMRNRRSGAAVTDSVTPEPEDVTDVTLLQSDAPDSPSSQVSPLHPPSSPPPAAGAPTPARGAAPKRRSGKSDRLTEAKQSSADTAIPNSLATEAFRAAWAEWCSHREMLAEGDAKKRWTSNAARNCIRQCESNGEAWALVEIRHSLANGNQGLFWDQRRNPADVRSQPMLPLNKPGKPEVRASELIAASNPHRWDDDHLAPNERMQ